MEPVALVVSALTAGAAAAISETAGSAIKDAYQALKSLVRKRLQVDPGGDAVLDHNEREPGEWSGTLTEALVRTDAASDVEIVELARLVLAEADPYGMAAGKYTVNVTGPVGIIGDHGNATMNFGATRTSNPGADP